jgi:hypothetical protein
MISILQTNPGLIVAVTLCIAPPVILCLIGFILGRAAWRGLALIAGLVGPIALIFLIGQLTIAHQPTASATHGLPKLEIQSLLGNNIVPQSLQEAKAAFPGIMDQAIRAHAALTPEGQTTVLAEFRSENEARTAAAAYHRAFGLHSVTGDEISGWSAKRRLQQDFVEMLVAGSHLIIWTGSTAGAAAQCRSASHIPDGLIPVRVTLVPELQPLRHIFGPTSVKVLGVVLLVGVYALWFFKAVAW